MTLLDGVWHLLENLGKLPAAQVRGLPREASLGREGADAVRGIYRRMLDA